jgi:ribonuclease BN (tRNA processing enzyme)
MKLTFTGCGGAFTIVDGQFQTNAVLEHNDRHMLIDCGSDMRHAYVQTGGLLVDIDAVYISHLHADHVGGMEWLAFCTYFTPDLKRPTLFCDSELMSAMWFNSLRGGLDSIEGKVMDLTDYFDCKPIAPNGEFKWKGAKFEPVQTVHVMAGRKIVHSYGLMITTYGEDNSEYRTFYTSDTQFCPYQIQKFYQMADIIFHDCETTPFKSGVHAHFEDLTCLAPGIKKKMWLMHYAQVKPIADMQVMARDSGFAGFVESGQSFDLPHAS